MQIGVIGCGVAGMAAALALSRQGHGVTILERFAAPRPVGAGLLLQPTGLAALAALNLDTAVRAHGAPVTRLEGHTPSGRTVLDLSYRGAAGLGVHRGALFSTLFDALAPAGVTVRAGVSVRDLDTSLSGEVYVYGEESAPFAAFDMVVIADGSDSQLRARVDPKARAPVYPWGAFWAIQPDPDGRWNDVLRQVYAKARIMIGVLPVGRDPNAAAAAGEQGAVSFFWSLRGDAVAHARDQGIDALRASVAYYWPSAAELLNDVADMSELATATYRDVRARTHPGDRIVVIGDAAHGTSPQLGQGANLALIDGLMLAHELGPADAARLRASSDVNAALARFARVRSAPVGYTQLLSRLLTPLFQSERDVLAAARDLALPVACATPGLRAIMRATLTGRAQLAWGGWTGPWERAQPVQAAKLLQRSADEGPAEDPAKGQAKGPGA